MASIPAPVVLQDNPNVVNWICVPQLHINADNPIEPYAIFMNTATGGGACVPGQWYVVDLTAAPWSLPATAVVAFLSGRLIITDPAAGETGNITMTLRAHGSELDAANYQFQADSYSSMGASTSRSGMASWVPLNQGVFEFCWNCTTPSPRDGVSHTSYGINLSLQAWG